VGCYAVTTAVPTYIDISLSLSHTVCYLQQECYDYKHVSRIVKSRCEEKQLGTGVLAGWVG
jgi:hypothetical protein